MPDRFCIDVIFVMSHLQEKCLSVEGYLYHLFIDVKNVFIKFHAKPLNEHLDGS